MKKIYLLLLGLCILCLLIFQQCRVNQPEAPIIAPESRSEGGDPSQPVTADSASTQDDSDFLSNVEKVITLQNSSNSKFEFYGLVVDQHGEPVEGAVVKLKTRAYKRSIGLKLAYTRDDFIRKDEVEHTNASGRFVFNDGYGSGLTIEEISKEGYVSARGQMNATFLSTSGGRHHPDESAPVIYTMWKKAGAEPLIKEEFSFKFLKGAPAQGISLVGGKWIKTNTSAADLIVSASMGEPNPKRRNQFDWQVTIEPVNGGLIKTDDIFPYTAPESGYEKNYTFSQKEATGSWASSIRNQAFYVKAQDGQVYATVTIDFRVHPFGYFYSTVRILANPNSSRNLEYDPELRIKR
ncbi:MAG: hypothetical protein ABF330_05375 [Lentimonas sp.]